MNQVTDAQYGVLQALMNEIEKKNSWGKNELMILIAKLCAKQIDSKAFGELPG